MEEFKLSNRDSLLDKAEALIKEGIKYGLEDLHPLLDKVDSLRKAMHDEVIRIVLVGSFSDGKTSAIAGLLGKLEDDMKIDMKESSDEISVYKLGQYNNIEIIDTPGLFGTKEKEESGNYVKLSDITKRYLSEADIIMYVCNANNPLKDSHVSIVKWILRDLDKLSSTIFVINKMDKAGFDLSNDFYYHEGNNVKKENLITRLRTAINLTPDEERHMHIVCISANPKGKGLEYWFSNTEKYMSRSRIGELRDEVTNVVNESDKVKLKDKTSLVSIHDMMDRTKDSVDEVLKTQNSLLPKAKDTEKDMEEEEKILHVEITDNWKSLCEELDAYRGSLTGSIQNASLETFGQLLETQIGVGENGVLSFSIVKRKMNEIFVGSAQRVDSVINSHNVVFNQGFTDLENFFKGIATSGANWLDSVNINNEQVFKGRDVIDSSYKFKPYGAIKLADSINKVTSYAATGINLLMEGYDIFKQFNMTRKLEKAKQQIINVIHACFTEWDKCFVKEEDYLKNFAPQYYELQKQLENSKQELASMTRRIKELETYSAKVKGFIEAEEAEYSEA